MNLIPNILFSLNIAVASILFTGCDSKKIEGQVVDPLGKPLANVNIQVELTQFEAISKSNGSFKLDYAPGQFTLKISKTGYTTEKIPLSIQQKSKVPLQPTVLYPIPETMGIFLLSEGGLKKVSDDCKITKSIQSTVVGNKDETTYTYFINPQNDLINDFSSGELNFIYYIEEAMTPVMLSKNKGNKGGIALEHVMPIWGFTEPYNKYSGFLKEKTAKVGQEQLLIRTITTERNSRYAWVPIYNPFFSDDILIDEKKPCFYFTADTQENDGAEEVQTTNRNIEESSSISQTQGTIQPAIKHDTSQGTALKKEDLIKDQQTTQGPIVPIHRQGDTYNIESINSDTKTSTITERKVISATSEKIVTESRNSLSKSGKVRILEFTSEWNLIAITNSDSSRVNYSPPLKYYEFPLTLGKTWRQKSIETNTKTNVVREHILSGVVGDWENVTVPAGSFRAIKVTIQTELLDRSSGQKSIGTDTSWYVPEVRRSVRSLTSSRSPQGVESKQDLQLIRYNLIK